VLSPGGSGPRGAGDRRAHCGRTLMPILDEVGIEAGQPSIINIHRLDQAAVAAQPSVEAR